VNFEEVMGFGAREAEKKRVSDASSPLRERIEGFKEIHCGLKQETAMDEAARCLHCTARFWPIFGRRL
jgi:hypothetical protein